MKTVLLILLQSFVLTIFFTLMAQAFMRTPGVSCKQGVFSLKKCASNVEALRGSWR